MARHYIIGLFILLISHTAIAQESYSWVALQADGHAIARHVSESNDQCPDITVNGHAKPMQQRSPNSHPSGFSTITVCEYPIPLWAKHLNIAGTPLPLPVASPKKIAVIGDTGCRMKGSDFQNCNNVKGLEDPWLFAQLADKLAKLQPDLIIHVGDYHYRETPCPEGNAGCTNSPYGNNWESWKIDFFEPAQQLLASAPWIMTRGNHEDCDRAWRGWFYLLDPATINTGIWDSCPEFTPPYAVPFREFQIAVLDSTTVPHSYSPPPDPETVKQYGDYYDQINQLAQQGETWVMTHRPIWAVSSYSDSSGNTQLSTIDATLQAALEESQQGSFADNISLLLAGHIHLYEYLNFEDGRPPMMVVGGSGTELNPPITQQLINDNPQIFESLGLASSQFTSYDEISFVILEPERKTWRATLHSLKGKLDTFTIPR